MKAGLVAIAASSLLGSAAAKLHHRHAEFHARRQPNVFERGADNDTCACSYTTSVSYGPMTLHNKPPPAPTPVVSSYSTPGTYTIPSSTITLSETTTVASATTTPLGSGAGTYGGHTTSVSKPTTVTVPVGTVAGSSPATTSIVKTSTHYCSTAGICVVGGTSTSISTSTVMVYPVPATYTPGTYTVPQSIVTVTDTNTVYVCPYSSYKPTSEASKPTPESPKSTYEAPKPTPESPKSTYEAPKPETTPASPGKPQGYTPAPKPSSPAAPGKPEGYTPAPKPSSPAAPVKESPTPKPKPSEAPKPKPSQGSGYGSGGNGGSASISPKGNQWAMSYTPYTPTGECKTAGEVDSDIGQIAQKGFSAVRLYATDCSGLQNVGGSCKKHGLKIILGVFIDNKGIPAAQEQVDQIKEWGSQGNWGTVEMCVIGNEAIFNGYVSASQLASFIKSTKNTLKGAGYSGPCTTTEPLGTLMANKGAICDVVDVVMSNIQPFFNAAVSPSSAGDFVASQLELTAQQCPGKEAYNGECGWPSNGSANGKAIPGTIYQKQAIKSILSSSAASKTVMFAFQNDSWKAAGAWGAEPYFGCIDNF